MIMHILWSSREDLVYNPIPVLPFCPCLDHHPAILAQWSCPPDFDACSPSTLVTFKEDNLCRLVVVAGPPPAPVVCSLLKHSSYCLVTHFQCHPGPTVNCQLNMATRSKSYITHFFTGSRHLWEYNTFFCKFKIVPMLSTYAFGLSLGWKLHELRSQQVRFVLKK